MDQPQPPWFPHVRKILDLVSRYGPGIDPLVLWTIINVFITVSLYYMLEDQWPEVTPEKPLVLMGLLVVVELFIVSYRYFTVRERGRANPVEQVVRDVKVSRPGSPEAEDLITVHLLTRNADSRSGEGQAKLSLASMFDGAERLRESLPNEKIALCVGINPAGLLLATYLAQKYDVRREDVAVILTGFRDGRSGKREIHDALPEAHGLLNAQQKLNGRILLVDDEYKTGESARMALELLKERYHCEGKDVWYVVLVACGIGPDAIKGAAKPTRLRELLHESRRRFLESSGTALGEKGQDDPDNRTSPIFPHRVAFFTPGRIAMPWEI
ncbi:MAG: phosphoribosyltransferase [Phycisphaerales bacterium]|nr:MAG: phosphoribosyltransferase [Phycisphaerales bacterium]